MDFSSVVLAAPTTGTVRAVPESESAAGRPARTAGADKGRNRRRNGYGAGEATRDAALYCARVDGKFTTPRTAVSAERAWELLVLATEALDDALVGYTNHSMEKCARIDALCDQIAAQNPIPREYP
jgi:hypothetical protein